MINRSTSRGFSLLELLAVIAIVAIISSLAIPNFVRLIQSSQQKAAVSELVSLLNFARHKAIHNQAFVTVCPIDQGSCVKDWSKVIHVFEDPNKAGKLVPGTKVLRMIDLSETGKLFGHTGIHRYFRFEGSGMVDGTLGNIIWCPENLESTLAAQIRLNMGGRPKLAKDLNGDGVVEDALGKPVTCA